MVRGKILVININNNMNYSYTAYTISHPLESDVNTKHVHTPLILCFCMCVSRWEQFQLMLTK